MAFKKEEFTAWLSEQGLKSTRTYCYYLRKAEKQFKSGLDAEYLRDRCETLSERINSKLEENRPKVKKKPKGSKTNTKTSLIKKRRYIALRQMRNSLNKYLSFRLSLEGCEQKEDHTLLSEETEKRLASVDWNKKDMMIGTVRDSRQLVFVLKHRGYYVPAYFIDEDKLPIKFIALHEQGIGSSPGIKFYGEVITAQRVKRKRIPVPMSRPNGNEIYYYFKVRAWKKLSHSIDIRDTHRGAPLFTNSFLLEGCAQSYQLLSVASAEDYRLMTAINEAFKELRENKEEVTSVYHISRDIYLEISDNTFILTKDRKEVLERISVGSYSYRPKDSFEKFKTKLK